MKILVHESMQGDEGFFLGEFFLRVLGNLSQKPGILYLEPGQGLAGAVKSILSPNPNPLSFMPTMFSRWRSLIWWCAPGLPFVTSAICCVNIFSLPYVENARLCWPGISRRGFYSLKWPLQTSFRCWMQVRSQCFQPIPKVLPFSGDLVSSWNLSMLYASGEGFSLAFLRITSEIGLRFPFPKVQDLLWLVVGSSGSMMSLQLYFLVRKRSSREKEQRWEVLRQVAADWPHLGTSLGNGLSAYLRMAFFRISLSKKPVMAEQFLVIWVESILASFWWVGLCMTPQQNYATILNHSLIISSCVYIQNIMSWYGNFNDATKKLDSLIDQKPTFAQLACSPDFIPQLKAFNPKLLDYLTNSTAIPPEITSYICVAPLESDSHERKYRFPSLAIEAIETETTCIVNCLLKPKPDCKQNYFQAMFQMFAGPAVLPLLAGYFSRVCLVLYRTCYREAIDSVYSSIDYMLLLINHAQHDAVTQCICVFLNIETSKGIMQSEERAQLKQKVVVEILKKIEERSKHDDEESVRAVENLCMVLQEMVQKYYLIADGKLLLEIVLDSKHSALIISLISAQKESSFPAMLMALMILKYYSFSAFNSEEGSEELAKRNMERLEQQPFIRLLCENYNQLFNRVKACSKLTLYHFKLTEVLCHCMTLSSNRMMGAIKESELFPVMIDLMFREEKCSIFHTLLDRAIKHIIITDRRIFDKYRRYLFCEIFIMDLTIKRLLDIFPNEDGLEQARKKPYFGILMNIVKTYSAITTADPLIKETITSQSKIWNKASKLFIKPYEALTQPKLGEHVNVPEPVPVAYKITKAAFIPHIIENVLAMKQINEQENKINKALELAAEPKKEDSLAENPSSKIEDDTFFSVPISESLERKKSQNQNQISEYHSSAEKSNTQTQQDSQKDSSDIAEPAKEQKPGFSGYMNKRLVEVGAELKLKRTESEQKRLGSAGKRRLMSPSPSRKRDKWKSDDEQQQPKKEVIKKKNLSTDLPKIPTAAPQKNTERNNLSKSSVSEPKKMPQVENMRRMSMSNANLESLKHTVVKRVAGPPLSEKKYRVFQEKDKALLQFLGIDY